MSLDILNSASGLLHWGAEGGHANSSISSAEQRRVHEARVNVLEGLDAV